MLTLDLIDIVVNLGYGEPIAFYILVNGRQRAQIWNPNFIRDGDSLVIETTQSTQTKEETKESATQVEKEETKEDKKKEEKEEKEKKEETAPFLAGGPVRDNSPPSSSCLWDEEKTTYFTLNYQCE